MMRHDPIDPGQFVGIERPVIPEPPACVRDRMTRPAMTIRWDEPVARAAQLMEERQIRHLPVVDAGRRLVGIITADDLSEALVSKRFRDVFAAPPTLIAGKVMTWKAIAVSPSCELAEAAKLMRAHALSALPVVEHDEVVGILMERGMPRMLTLTMAHG